MKPCVIMKTAVIPQVRIEPALRFALESALRDGETISEFVEADPDPVSLPL